jgi:zinc transport system substrate-binding protein
MWYNYKKKGVFMKKLLLLIIGVFLFGLNITVTLPPQRGLIKLIAPNVKVNVMVPPGSSPATYSPTFKQLKALKNSDIYFTIGVPFDKKYLPKIKEMNPKIKIVNFGSMLIKHKNPHIWLSPSMLMLEAKVILNTLIRMDPKNKMAYVLNYNKLIKDLDYYELYGFQTIKQKAFITFHPSFYYFAKDFLIKEIALEKDGKTPSFAFLEKVIKIGKKENVKTVIISPEFPKKYALIIAKRLKAKVIELSPLNENVFYTMKTLIEALK